jgi:capsular polysaccharide biosynthesis protein
MELRTALTVLFRRWWLVIGLPIVVLIATLALSNQQPYVATVRAVILIPGDTETPGDSERPELMVLDDTPIVVGSQAFADAVEAQLQSRLGGVSSDLDDEAIQESLSAERYSRTLTIRVTRDDAAEALAIGQAVATVLPNAINNFLIADGGQPATVDVIDRPEGAVRDTANRRMILIVQTFVALAVGAGLAALAAALDQKLYPENVEDTLGLPVLADVRTTRRRWWDLRPTLPFPRSGRA